MVVGGLYLYDCPQGEYIPVYLLVGGGFGVLKQLLRLPSIVRNRPEERDEERIRQSPAQTLINCFMLGWFIIGKNSFWKIDRNGAKKCWLVFRFHVGVQRIRAELWPNARQVLQQDTLLVCILAHHIYIRESRHNHNLPLWHFRGEHRFPEATAWPYLKLYYTFVIIFISLSANILTLNIDVIPFLHQFYTIFFVHFYWWYVLNFDGEIFFLYKDK